MPWGLKRFQNTGDLHFITFSCYHREPLLISPEARRVFESTFESVRRWYGFFVTGYVVMPEHVHFLVNEPERATLAVAIQMLKQNTATELRWVQRPRPSRLLVDRTRPRPFWQLRYYDFNVWSKQKIEEKLQYMHFNPVKRGLVSSPEDWEWSSVRHYQSGVEGVVEIESWWTNRKREALGIFPSGRYSSASEIFVTGRGFCDWSVLNVERVIQE